MEQLTVTLICSYYPRKQPPSRIKLKVGPSKKIAGSVEYQRATRYFFNERLYVIQRKKGRLREIVTLIELSSCTLESFILKNRYDFTLSIQTKDQGAPMLTTPSQKLAPAGEPEAKPPETPRSLTTQHAASISARLDPKRSKPQFKINMSGPGISANVKVNPDGSWEVPGIENAQTPLNWTMDRNVQTLQCGLNEPVTLETQERKFRDFVKLRKDELQSYLDGGEDATKTAIKRLCSDTTQKSLEVWELST